MYEMNEIEKIIAIELNNMKVRWVKDSKIRYEKNCKDMDDLVIEYKQTNDIDGRSLFLHKITKLKGELEQSHKSLKLEIERYGHIHFDDSMFSKEVDFINNN